MFLNIFWKIWILWNILEYLSIFEFSGVFPTFFEQFGNFCKNHFLVGSCDTGNVPCGILETIQQHLWHTRKKIYLISYLAPFLMKLSKSLKFMVAVISRSNRVGLRPVCQLLVIFFHLFEAWFPLATPIDISETIQAFIIHIGA